jgi:uncharacterized protein (TIGR02145 family)
MTMKVTLTIAMFLWAMIALAQDNMYIMKNNVVVGKYNLNTEIDSVIFYLPNSDPGASVTDADGNIYSVVTIGTQTWMAENLKTTKYNDGTNIPLVTNLTTWGNLTTPAYCYYDNQPAYGGIYGALYNWYTVNTGKLCPTGWHIPTEAEWTTLSGFLGGTNVAGGKLKEQYMIHWDDPNAGATNEVGFTALPGGKRNTFSDVSDLGIGSIGNFWASTEGSSAQYSRMRNLRWNDAIMGATQVLKTEGLSCRCVKD